MPTKMMRSIVKKLPKAIRAPILRSQIEVDETKLEGLTFKIAMTIDELDQSYRLVHDAYVRQGYMDQVASGIRINIHHALPLTTTFIGKTKDKIALTMTIFPDSDIIGLPMDCIYNEELNRLRKKGRRIAEVGSLATAPDFRNSNQNVPMHGNKIMYTYAKKYLKIEDLIIAIHPKQKWFYENILLFEPIGELKHHPYVKQNPAIAMRLDLRTAQKNYQKIYDGKKKEQDLHHFFCIKNSQCIELPQRHEPLKIWDLEKWTYFFEDGFNHLHGINPKIIQHIKDQYNQIRPATSVVLQQRPYNELLLIASRLHHQIQPSLL